MFTGSLDDRLIEVIKTIKINDFAATSKTFFVSKNRREKVTRKDISSLKMMQIFSTRLLILTRKEMSRSSLLV